ncbi:MAG: putative lipid II flippase FtsW [bacterium]
MEGKLNKFDRAFFACIIILVLFGFVMVLNASYMEAFETWHDGLHFVKRHSIFLFLGFISMMALSRYDYKKLQKLIFPLFVLTLVLLALTLVPHIGHKIKGARRWINIGFFSFQTSEFAKYVLILFLANYYQKHQDYQDSFLRFLIIPFLFLCTMFGLIILQPNFSTVAMLCIIAGIIMFVAGARWKHMIIATVPIVVGGGALVAYKAYRMKRVTSFLDPWADPQGKGFQAIQSFIAFHSGGFWGVGLGAGKQKLSYLPEAHNDFIFAIIAEELGFIGILGVLAVFFFLIYKGIRIAIKTQDLFGRLLVFGIMFLISMHVLINVGVVLGIFPVTGLPLPFVSYGGTSLISFMAFMGIVLNVSRGVEK